MIPPGISQKSTSKISRGNFLRSFCQEKRDILENFSKYSKLSSANSLRNNLYYPPGIPPENTSEILPKILSGNKKKNSHEFLLQMTPEIPSQYSSRKSFRELPRSFSMEISPWNIPRECFENFFKDFSNSFEDFTLTDIWIQFLEFFFQLSFLREIFMAFLQSFSRDSPGIFSTFF